MEASDATKRSGSSSYAHYLSGWCPECGRRRGADARCANCDPWWTSPLFQVGIPAVLVAFLAISRAAMTWGRQHPVSAPSTTVSATHGVDSESAGYWPGTPVRIAAVVSVPYRPAPSIYVPVMPVRYATPVFSPVVSPESVRQMQMEQIRRQGQYLDSVLRADAILREERDFAIRRNATAAALQQMLDAQQASAAAGAAAPT